MIIYVTGIPGSGKSIKGVYEIKKDLDSKKPRYKYIYTNINQFKLDLSPRLHYYDHDKVFKCITFLHKLYKKKFTDEKLIRASRLLKLHKSLFVIDEAHNYFDVRNPVLVWWLSYHRHLYQDIILITQNLSLIDSKYKAFAEYFYRATPQSLKLFQKNFKYNLFVDSRMSKNSKAGVEIIKYDPDLFKLYHSGDKPKTKNFLLYFISIAVVVALLVAFGFQALKAHYMSAYNEKQSKNSTHQTSKNPQNPSPSYVKKIAVPEYDLSQNRLISIHCISSICRYENKYFPLRIVKKLVEKTNSDLLSISTDMRSFRTEIHLIASGDFLNLFQGVSYEKNIVPSVDDIYDSTERNIAAAQAKLN